MFLIYFNKYNIMTDERIETISNKLRGYYSNIEADLHAIKVALDDIYDFKTELIELNENHNEIIEKIIKKINKKTERFIGYVDELQNALSELSNI